MGGTTGFGEGILVMEDRYGYSEVDHDRAVQEFKPKTVKERILEWIHNRMIKAKDAHTAT